MRHSVASAPFHFQGPYALLPTQVLKIKASSSLNAYVMCLYDTAPISFQWNQCLGGRKESMVYLQSGAQFTVLVEEHSFSSCTCCINIFPVTIGRTWVKAIKRKENWEAVMWTVREPPCNRTGHHGVRWSCFLQIEGTGAVLHSSVELAGSGGIFAEMVLGSPLLSGKSSAYL